MHALGKSTRYPPNLFRRPRYLQVSVTNVWRSSSPVRPQKPGRGLWSFVRNVTVATWRRHRLVVSWRVRKTYLNQTDWSSSTRESETSTSVVSYLAEARALIMRLQGNKPLGEVSIVDAGRHPKANGSYRDYYIDWSRPVQRWEPQYLAVSWPSRFQFL